MKILHWGKDGGPESRVWGFWLFESKRFGSIAFLNFKEGSREVFHNHAFNAKSWMLYGKCKEEMFDGSINYLTPSVKPLTHSRECFHRVFGEAKNSWFITFRGPWLDKWNEWFPSENKTITLTHGRKIINENSTD